MIGGDENEPDSREGSRFGPYQLVRLLGRGGMGAVYAAERITDTPGHCVVAVKLISERFSASPVFRLRMQREAEVGGLLTEPHLVPMHAYGEVDGTVYVEMPLIDGTDLATLLGRFGPMSPARAVAIVAQVAAALDAAHHAGVIHRDVKPENILVTGRDGGDFAYLTDLGIARAAADPGLTQVGTAVEALRYMAPERFTGDAVTHRCDVYALAGVLSQCLTGSPPYPADSVEQALAAHLSASPPKPSQLQPGRVPTAFDEVIAKGLAKKPADRYRSAGELAAAAGDALAETEPGSEPGCEPDQAGKAVSAPAGSAAAVVHPLPAVSRPRRNCKPVLLGAAAFVAVVVVAAAGYLGTRPSHPSSVAAPAQTVLPFTGLDYRLSPGGVAVDVDGTVYVTSQGMSGHVLKLPSGSVQPTVLAFTGLHEPQGVAVDDAGTVYVADFSDRVVKLAAGSESPAVLPFRGLDNPQGVAVDSDGNVYVADRGNDRVVKLAAGANAQTVLPFGDLDRPHGVAVDSAGSVYVTDTGNDRVLKLGQGSAAPAGPVALPLTGIATPWGVSVDTAGNVYVTERDTNKVVKSAVGSAIPSVVPFTGLNAPLAVAVDKDAKNGRDEQIYVADRGNNRVVKLATQ